MPTYTREQKQVRVFGVDIEDIMRTEAFCRGVEDARAGRRPRFDGKGVVLMPVEQEEPTRDMNSFINRQWNYERGRQFGILAPRNMSVMMPRAKRVNPKAIGFYRFMNDDI